MRGQLRDFGLEQRRRGVDLSAADNVDPTFGSNALPVIGGDIAIEGHGSELRSGGFGRVFQIAPGATLRLTDVTVSGGYAYGSTPEARSGGGIYNRGTLILEAASVIHNRTADGPPNFRAGDGGGIYNDHGTVTATDSTISGNSSGRAGESISTPSPDGDGGGIHHTGSGNLRNVTIAHNTAGAGRGGGVAAVPGALHIANSILAGNSAGSNPDCRGNLISEGHNLIGSDEGCSGLAGEGDQLGTPELPIDPVLDELQNNGGPTFTDALSAGSPAIDAGNPDGCTDASDEALSSDQRGEPRAQDGDADGQAICDIGAYERGQPQ